MLLMVFPTSLAAVITAVRQLLLFMLILTAVLSVLMPVGQVQCNVLIPAIYPNTVLLMKEQMTSSMLMHPVQNHGQLESRLVTALKCLVAAATMYSSAISNQAKQLVSVYQKIAGWLGTELSCGRKPTLVWNGIMILITAQVMVVQV